MRKFMSLALSAAVATAALVAVGAPVPAAGTASLATASHVSMAPALTYKQCQSEASRRRTTCLSGSKIAGARCTMSQSGVLSLTKTGSLVACKKSWGTVYTWVWAAYGN
jgi:hypothetical protein